MRKIIDSSVLKPVNVTWELTLGCNLRCRHCGSSAGKCRRNEISLKRALRLCKELKELGTMEVTLIGGEPMLSEKLFPIMERLSLHGIKSNVVSNGTIMSNELAEKLKKAGVNNFGISIDGNEKTNDLVRGKGVFKKVASTIKILQKHGIRHSIATTVAKYNFPELNEIYRILLRLNVKVWQIQLAMPVGRMDPLLMLEKKNLKKLIKFIIKVRNEGKIRIFPGCNIGYFGGLEEKYRIQEEEKTLPFWTGCYSGIFEVGIMSNGSVKGCLAMKDKFIEGNILEKPLKEIWGNKDAFPYNRKFKKSSLGSHCSKCEYGEVCRGGCPIISEALTGKTNNDTYCIERLGAE